MPPSELPLKDAAAAWGTTVDSLRARINRGDWLTQGKARKDARGRMFVTVPDSVLLAADERDGGESVAHLQAELQDRDAQIASLYVELERSREHIDTLSIALRALAERSRA